MKVPLMNTVRLSELFISSFPRFHLLLISSLIIMLLDQSTYPAMQKEPKFGHLRDLHNIIRSYQKAFLEGKQSFEILAPGYEVGNNCFYHFCAEIPGMFCVTVFCNLTDNLLLVLISFFHLQAHNFEIPEEKLCLAFLSNNNTGEDGTVNFRGEKFYIPSRSVSILADCKHVVYNTKRVGALYTLSCKLVRT